MEQRLKERVVGAIVVVGLGVIFIPMFLSGPRDPSALQPRAGRDSGLDGPTRVVTIDLRQSSSASPQPDALAPDTAQAQRAAGTSPGQDAGQAGTSPDSTSPEKDSPPPAAQVPGAGAPAVQPVRPVQPQSDAATAADSGEWAVQVGSFSSRDNARRLADQLQQQGFAAFVTRYVDGGRQLHRVRVGPVASRSEAEALAEKLGQAGQKAKVVPNP